MSLSALVHVARWVSEARPLPAEHADVGVVLGGHPRVRVPAAVDLLNSGTIPRIALVGGRLVDGRPAEVRRSEEWAAACGVPKDQLVCLEAEALGTVEEAHVVLRAASRQDWRRVVVITSPYHCRRTAQIFRSVFAAQGVEAWVFPSPYDTWDETTWHTDARLRRLVGRELVKMLLWRTGLRKLVRPERP